jgi:predicted nucleotidyltransferase
VNDAMKARLRAAAVVFDDLDALVLFGSRARGDARTTSDWDFGYLGAASLDMEGLLAALVTMLDTDRVDLVDLARAGGQLRYRVAADGRPVFERMPGAFARFRLEAVTFWCDAEAVITRGYDRVLEALRP